MRLVMSVDGFMRTTIQPIDLVHGITSQMLMFREPGLMTRSNPIHGTFAKRWAHKAIGCRDRATDITLNRLWDHSRSLRPLQMGMRMRQMADTSWVTTSQRAFLEMALQDVASGEGILAEDTHVRTVSGICKGLRNQS